MKEIIKKLIYRFLFLLNRIFYPKIDLRDYNSFDMLKAAFFQKVLGFNRNVYWPVHRSTTVKAAENISRGTRLPGFSKNCHLDGRNGIIFGDNVWVGPNVTIVSMNHDLNNYSNYIKANPIIIKDNCWIAGNVIILAEVELAEHTIIAAGAVVTKSFLEGNQLIGGNPAKVIKKLNNYIDKDVE